MYDIFSVAKAFLSIAPVSYRKLQALCYYAQAWHLALFNRRLISESFFAGVNGAIAFELMEKYQKYGFELIPQYKETDLPGELTSYIKEVYRAYGHLDELQLEKLTHNEKPWLEARKNIKPWESIGKKISERTMKKYYRDILNAIE